MICQEVQVWQGLNTVEQLELDAYVIQTIWGGVVQLFIYQHLPPTNTKILIRPEIVAKFVISKNPGLARKAEPLSLSGCCTFAQYCCDSTDPLNFESLLYIMEWYIGMQ